MKQDKAFQHYAWGLGVLSFIQMLMSHGLLDNPNKLKAQELIVDGADLTALTELAADVGNSFITSVGTGVVLVACTLLSGAVMLLLRYVVKDLFTPDTKRRGLIAAAVSFGVCLFAGLLFGGLHQGETALFISLPVPVISWLVYHIGRVPVDRNSIEQQIGEDQYY